MQNCERAKAMPTRTMAASANTVEASTMAEAEQFSTPL